MSIYMLAPPNEMHGSVCYVISSCDAVLSVSARPASDASAKKFISAVRAAIARAFIG